jgi:hypothetical protein
MTQINYTTGHTPYFGPALRVKSMTELRPGDVIECQYDGVERHFFVLNSPIDNKLHCLSLRHMPRHVLLSSIVAHMDLAVNPLNFYNTIIARPEISIWDAYRTLNTKKMSSTRKMYYILDDRAMVQDTNDPITPTTNKQIKTP